MHSSQPDTHVVQLSPTILSVVKGRYEECEDGQSFCLKNTNPGPEISVFLRTFSQEPKGHGTTFATFFSVVDGKSEDKCWSSSSNPNFW